jgi:N-acetylneuraminic acid mutarotase
MCVRGAAAIDDLDGDGRLDVAVIGGDATGRLTEAYNPSTDTWSTKAAMPTARWNLAAAAVNNVIYAIGGGNNEAYDPSNNTWSAKAAMSSARSWLAAVAVNNVIYTIGGWVPFTSTGGNEAYDPSTDTWSTRAAMPTPRQGVVAGAVNGFIYAIGGDNGNRLGTNEAYDTKTFFVHAKN